MVYKTVLLNIIELYCDIYDIYLIMQTNHRTQID